MPADSAVHTPNRQHTKGKPAVVHANIIQCNTRARERAKTDSYDTPYDTARRPPPKIPATACCCRHRHHQRIYLSSSKFSKKATPNIITCDSDSARGKNTATSAIAFLVEPRSYDIPSFLSPSFSPSATVRTAVALSAAACALPLHQETVNETPRDSTPDFQPLSSGTKTRADILQ